MPQTATLCPYFQTSDDGADSLEHLLELTAGRFGEPQDCTTCRKPVILCPLCGSANRLLSRCCRNCGKTLPSLHWPVMGGSWDSLLLSQEVGLPKSAQPCALPPLDSAALLALGGILVQVGKEDQARLLRSDKILASVPFPPSTNNSKVISTCLLGGLLVAGLSERLLVNDLVDILAVSPGSPTRRRSLPLRGELAAPLATDGQTILVALSRDQGRGHLQVFQSQGTRLQLSWARPLDEDGGHASWLSVSGAHLLHASESGALECFALDTGELLGTLQLPVNLAYFPPLARQIQQKNCWIVAGNDGSLFRVYPRPKLESTPLAPTCSGPLFGVGADSQQIVMCHGKSLRRIDGVSGKIYELELPQYCTVAPWVQKNRALAVSQEGTLYALSLGSSSFQVEHALRLPGNFQGATLAPVQLHGELWLVDGDGLLIQARLE